MATVTTLAIKGSVKKAVSGLRRIKLEGLRWQAMDPRGQVLGRMASKVENVLREKEKPIDMPDRQDGYMCIALKAKYFCVTGRKKNDNFYRWHTGCVGHLKKWNLKDQLRKDPIEVTQKSVLRKLLRNSLHEDRDHKVRIVGGSDHPFGDHTIEPYVMPRARQALIRALSKTVDGTTSPVRRRKTKLN